MLFIRLDEVLWEKCNHNPKLFLRRVSQQVLDNAALDSNFLEDFSRVLSSYTAYKYTAYQNLEHSPISSENFDPDETVLHIFVWSSDFTKVLKFILVVWGY